MLEAFIRPPGLRRSVTSIHGMWIQIHGICIDHIMAGNRAVRALLSGCVEVHPYGLMRAEHPIGVYSGVQKTNIKYLNQPGECMYRREARTTKYACMSDDKPFHVYHNISGALLSFVFCRSHLKQPCMLNAHDAQPRHSTPHHADRTRACCTVARRSPPSRCRPASSRNTQCPVWRGGDGSWRRRHQLRAAGQHRRRFGLVARGTSWWPGESRPAPGSVDLRPSAPMTFATPRWSWPPDT